MQKQKSKKTRKAKDESKGVKSNFKDKEEEI